MMNTRVHIQVDGRVQGVCFRYECRRVAAQLGLRGWVKNLMDGSVEIIAEGEQEMINRLVKWCRRGPAGAYVTTCEVTTEPPTGEFESFDIRF